jgi:cytochrome P450
MQISLLVSLAPSHSLSNVPCGAYVMSTEIPTFILAGHGTTSSLMAWVLFELGSPENAALQAALRTECRSLPLPISATDSAPLDAPDLAALDKLPLLDAVVRETLRLHSPVGSTIRSAIKDDVIPLSKPYTDRNGVLQDSIRVSEGDGVYVPITIVNRSVELWGPDAGMWKPERWMEGGKGIPAQVKAVPGVWGNVMTFLGGAHACIGFRFTLYEYVHLPLLSAHCAPFTPIAPFRLHAYLPCVILVGPRS